MALPALKREAPHGAPALRLLAGGRRPGSARDPRTRRGGAAQVAHQRRVFQSMVVLLVVVMGFGLLRVQVTVQATEATLAANALKEQIENERIRTEMLEADRSALATPSRIESIAQASMGMGAAQEISYLELPSLAAETADGQDPVSGDKAADARSSARIAAVLADVMEMAAGEAQVLLVGDAGLASSR